MIIRITAQGDPDATPLYYMFERSSADGVFAASVGNVIASLQQKRRINIHQAILLLAARAAESLDSGEEQARLAVLGLLSRGQVMIGVPEMTQNITISIEAGHKITTLNVHAPIT